MTEQTPKRNEIDWLRLILAEEEETGLSGGDYQRMTVEALLWLHDEVVAYVRKNPEACQDAFSGILSALVAARGDKLVPKAAKNKMYENTYIKDKIENEIWEDVIYILHLKARSMGLSVQPDDALGHYGGQCDYDQKLILINCPKLREHAFVLAHEIGHWIDFVKSGLKTYAEYSASKNIKERELAANREGFRLLTLAKAPITYDEWNDWYLHNAEVPV